MGVNRGQYAKKDTLKMAGNSRAGGGPFPRGNSGDTSVNQARSGKSARASFSSSESGTHMVPADTIHGALAKKHFGKHA
jgi:hypothetical protein